MPGVQRLERLCPLYLPTSPYISPHLPISPPGVQRVERLRPLRLLGLEERAQRALRRGRRARLLLPPLRRRRAARLRGGELETLGRG